MLWLAAQFETSRHLPGGTNENQVKVRPRVLVLEAKIST
jgi:hypothetical protein